MSKLSAYPVYLIMAATSAAFGTMMYVVIAVYYVQTVHLNPLQLVLVGTALESSYFVFQLPTGVLADTFSRRRSIIVGTCLIGLDGLLEGSIPVFAAILLARVVQGLGYAFVDGALEAWISDEVGPENAGRAYLRGGQVGQIGGLAGTIAGVGLASIRLNLPVVVGGALLMGLSLALVFVMPEHGFRPARRGERTRRQAMGGTLRDGLKVVRGRPLVLTILGVGLIFGAFSEGFDRLWQAHFLHNFSFPLWGGLKPVVWFGVISVGVMPLSLGAAEIARRRLDLNSHRAVAGALLALTALLIASIVAFGLAGSFALAVGAFWTATLLRQLSDPLYTAWLNQNVDPHVRATVLSMGGQANALGQAVCGPIVGAIGTVFSLRAAMVAAGAMLSPALLLYSRTLRHGRTPALLAEAPAATPDR